MKLDNRDLREVQKAMLFRRRQMQRRRIGAYRPDRSRLDPLSGKPGELNKARENTRNQLKLGEHEPHIGH